MRSLHRDTSTSPAQKSTIILPRTAPYRHCFSEPHVVMGLGSIQKVVLRAILRQASMLRREKRVLWLQTTPLIEEFQSSSYSSALEDLQLFISTFPSSIQAFLRDNIPSRVISGEDLRRAAVAAFRANPLQASSTTPSAESMSEALQCLKLVNNQVTLMESTSITHSIKDVRVVATAVYDRRQDDQKLVSFQGNN